MKKYFLFVLFFCSVISAQDSRKSLLTGNISYDSHVSFIESEKANYFNPTITSSGNLKSPFLASLMSFALPGAGQFYVKNYLESALFVAIEAAAITIGVVYDKKGDDQTSFFEEFANKNWDVKKYANWTIANIEKINTNVNPTDYQIFDVNGNVNWKELNRMESDIGGYYSHHLAPSGDQQYYEMIGKYPQFNPGWNDFGDEKTPFTYGDPLTENFYYYSRERSKANDYYNVASKAVVVILINHLLSAVDAAWSTSRYNKNLALSTELKRFVIGFEQIYYPQLNLKFCFN